MEKNEAEKQKSGEAEFSEAEILKQAEEREKVRKEEEEAEKAEAKAEAKAQKALEMEQKTGRKHQIRVKPRHGKGYRSAATKIEKDKEYPLDEAIDLILGSSTVKFDSTVEMHVKVNAKDKSVIRGMVVLPGGVIKQKKVLEVTAENADEVVAQVKAGKIDFDVMIAEIKAMPKLAVLAKVLGPKGLMPSPKAGTAVMDVKAAAAEFKAGKVEYRADKNNIVHIAIGKISFGKDKVKQNYEAILSPLPKKIDSIYLTTTMGPSVKVARK